MRPNTMKLYENQRFGEERALYGSRGVHLRGCAFDGEEDGESALKESSQILVENTLCNLRYPFWHDEDLTLINCRLTPLCRAALWYSSHIEIRDSQLHGIKALRECEKIGIRGGSIVSPEFGWSSREITLENTSAEGEYFLLRAEGIQARELRFRGKYSFQYARDVVIEDSILDTKDAFWHAENVTVKNSVVKGEYLAWYSKGLTLIGCKIIGTQPLCYCKDLRLIDCEMIGTDLSFERSEVEASLTAPIVSIKNPYKGHITAPAAGEVILDDPAARCRITLTEQNEK